MRQWRLIVDKHRRGPVNMAIDEAILLSVMEGRQPPTLRLYGWEPFCLSMGYGQRVREIDRQRLEDRGWDIVRRPTGGRAILHGDEVTYSISLPIDHPLAEGDVVESYRKISRGLMTALQHIGLSPRSERQDENYLREAKKGPVCFEVPSHYEITAGGLKLIGSAQVRRKEGILQHGSLPLYGDVGRITDALVYESDGERSAAADIVRQRATTLSSVLDRRVSWDSVAQAVARGFSETFDVDICDSALTDDERQRAEELLYDVYENPAWIEKR